MALIERLMHWSTEPVERQIAVHEFFAACTEVVNGALTSNQVQIYYAMTAEDIVDWSAVVATIPPAIQTANRAIWIERIHSVFLLAESRVPQYSTPAEVRTKLGI